MARFNPGECFYCGKAFVRATPTQKRARSLPNLGETIDHVYPTNIQIPNGLERNAILNKVRCCHRCNLRKGGKHPIHWLTLMENDRCATALGELLLKLGEVPRKVEHALTRRMRHV